MSLIMLTYVHQVALLRLCILLKSDVVLQGQGPARLVGPPTRNESELDAAASSGADVVVLAQDEYQREFCDVVGGIGGNAGYFTFIAVYTCHPVQTSRTCSHARLLHGGKDQLEELTGPWGCRKRDEFGWVDQVESLIEDQSEQEELVL
jgi:hypothetical protein